MCSFSLDGLWDEVCYYSLGIIKNEVASSRLMCYSFLVVQAFCLSFQVWGCCGSNPWGGEADPQRLLLPACLEKRPMR